MATQMKLRRGTTAQVDAFTPVEAEVVVDTDRVQLRLGDGVKGGGIHIPNALDIQQQAFQFGTVGGSADAITLTNVPPLIALVAGVRVSFKPTANNTGAVTLNVDGLGVKDLKKLKSGALVALDADDIVNGAIFNATYDGTQFQLAGGVGGAGGGLTFVEVANPSAVANIDFINLTTFDNYLFVFDLVPVNDNAELFVRFSVNNGSSFLSGSTDYRHASIGRSSVPGTIVLDSNGQQAQIKLSLGIGSAAGEGIRGHLKLLGRDVTAIQKMMTFQVVYKADDSQIETLTGGGMTDADTTNDVDAMQFRFSVDNIESGTVRVFGYNNG